MEIGLGELKACYVVINKAINAFKLLKEEKRKKITLTEIPFEKNQKDTLVWPNEIKKKAHGL